MGPPARWRASTERQVVLGDREHHRDRLDLGEHDEAARIVGVDHVAGIHEAEPGAAGDRRDDARVGELEANAVDLPLVGLDGRRELGDRGGLGVHLLLRDEAALDQGAVALEIHARVGQRGRVLGELRFRLGELGLEGAGIDLGQQIARPHDLALLEQRPHELAVHPAADRDDTEGGDRAEPVEVDAEIAAAGGDGHDRHRPGAGRGGRRLGPLGPGHRVVGAGGDEDRQDGADHPESPGPSRHAGPLPLSWLRL